MPMLTTYRAPGQGNDIRRAVRETRNSRLNKSDYSNFNNKIGVCLSISSDDSGKLSIVKSSYKIQHTHVYTTDLKYFIALAIFKNANATSKLLSAKPKDIRLNPNNYSFKFTKTELAEDFRQNGYNIRSHCETISHHNLIKTIVEIKELLEEHVSDLKPDQQEPARNLIRLFENYIERFTNNKALADLFLKLINVKQINQTTQTTTSNN